MRNFGRVLAASFALMIAAAFGADLTAQTAQTVQTRYTETVAREAELRRELDLAPQLRATPPGEASAALLRRVRATVTAYEDFLRRFPRSAYSDNALWQAGLLAADAFWQFGDTRDRTTALGLFGRLKAEFPGSSLVARIAGQTTRLNGVVGGAVEGAGSLAALKAIRREVLPDALRLTLELERETMFYEERLNSPARVFIDLRNTEPVDALKGATITFDDEVVRQARVGQQPDNRTRVVFDLRGAGRYSVYSLYNPYRLVIDFERVATKDTTTLPDTKDTKTVLATKDTNTVPATKDTKTVLATKDTKALLATRDTGFMKVLTVAPSVPARAGVMAPNPPPPSAAAANGAGGFSLSRQLGLGIARVVIDPGHGGHDPGAQVRGLNEAELVLDIALRLERLLDMEPGVNVVLTRRTNAYVPLEERTAIANRSRADLFLSIHANASANANLRGFETYFLNFAPSPEAEALAARENAASARTMGSLPDIVKAIALNNKIDESRDFASMVQGAMHERLLEADRNARNLGVKQAPFMVLIGATMPSVLAEVSFLTNLDEAGLLRSHGYRQQIAEALFAGVMKYQGSFKKAPVLRSGF